MPYLKSKVGTNWFYEMEGSGSTLLFLHGWGVNSLIWRQQFKYFSQTHQVIAIDLPGHGKTEWQNMNLTEIAFGIIDIFNQLNLNSVTIVGSSFGGLVGLKIFDIDPRIIRRFVLVGTQAKLSFSEDNLYGMDVQRIRKLANQLETAYPEIINIFFRSLFTKEERESRRFKWLQTFRKTDKIPERAALLNMLDILEKEDLRPVLHRLRIPLQFINGTEDTICPWVMISNLKEKLPQARFEWFTECGHFPFLSKPHEFNQVVEKFLTDTTRAS